MTSKILSALACGQGNCPCSDAVRRGKGKTHCPTHVDDTPSLDIQSGDDGKPLIFCHSCRDSEAIISALRVRGLWKSRVELNTGVPFADKKLVAEYTYTDKDGKPLFVVERYDPKDFRQRAASGTRSLEGITRVLYRLPEVLAAVERKEKVYVCEGEKDVDNLVAIGVAATTGSGGAGKWQDSYGEALVGADVVVIADKDDPGRLHARDVAQHCSVSARSVRILELPGLGKDASDWIAAGGSKLALEVLVDDTPEWEASEKVIWTPKDSAKDYREVIQKRLAGDPEYVGWPTGFRSLDKEMRYTPGEFWLVAAATSVGKTALLQSLQRRATVPSLIFSLEMSRTQILDRLFSAAAGVDAIKIVRGNLDASEKARLYAEIDRFEQGDIQIVDSSSLTTSTIETVLRIARVRFGIRIAYIDYVGLLRDRDGESKYVQMSNISHELKRIAKATGVCIVGASQVNRKGDRKGGEPPFMEEMRDTGTLEEDAAVVLAIGRAEGATEAKLAVRKNRHGLVGFTVPLHFDAFHAQFMELSEARRDRVVARGDANE